MTPDRNQEPDEKIFSNLFGDYESFQNYADLSEEQLKRFIKKQAEEDSDYEGNPDKAYQDFIEGINSDKSAKELLEEERRFAARGKLYVNHYEDLNQTSYLEIAKKAGETAGKRGLRELGYWIGGNLPWDVQEKIDENFAWYEASEAGKHSIVVNGVATGIGLDAFFLSNKNFESVTELLHVSIGFTLASVLFAGGAEALLDSAVRYTISKGRGEKEEVDAFVSEYPIKLTSGFFAFEGLYSAGKNTWEGISDFWKSSKEEVEQEEEIERIWQDVKRRHEER